MVMSFTIAHLKNFLTFTVFLDLVLHIVNSVLIEGIQICMYVIIYTYLCIYVYANIFCIFLYLKRSVSPLTNGKTKICYVSHTLACTILQENLRQIER